MTISLQCAACHRQYALADDKAGKKVRCQCGQVLNVPTLAAPPPLPPQPQGYPQPGMPGPQPYAAQPYGPQPYGPQPYGAQPYGAQPYGAQPYPYGGAPLGAFVAPQRTGPRLSRRNKQVLKYGLLGGGLLALVVLVAVAASYVVSPSLHPYACMALVLPTTHMELNLTPTQQQQLQPIVESLQHDLINESMDMMTGMAPMLQSQLANGPNLGDMQQGAFDLQQQAEAMFTRLNNRYAAQIEQVLSPDQIDKLNEIAARLAQQGSGYTPYRSSFPGAGRFGPPIGR